MSDSSTTLRVRTWDGPFLGRAEELAALAAAFASGERLVTILGPPGMGKTRLAREALAKLQAGGTASAVVDASLARDVEELRARVIAELGDGAPTPEGDAEEGVVRALVRAGRAVILVDNLEGTRGAAEEIARWLEQAREVAVLVTSRTRLKLGPELVVDLGPLDGGSCVELFLGRARRAVAGFSLSGEEHRVVLELARKLDQLPLAVELAAARVRFLRPRDLLARVDARMLLLTEDATGRSALLDAIDASFAALSEAARRALGYLSVGGVTQPLELAEALVRASGARDPVPVLEELVDASLVRAPSDADTTRFAMYESIRQFARLSLERSAELRQAEAALADVLCQLVDAWEAERVPDTLARLADIGDDLRRAAEREIDERPVVTARLALALQPLAVSRGPVDLHERFLVRLLPAVAPAIDPALVARLRVAAGVLCFLRGNVAAACDQLLSALDLATSLGLREVAGEARTTLLLAMEWRGEAGDAAVDEALDPHGLSAFGLFLSGLVSLHHGDVERAEGVLERARDGARAAGRAREAARALAVYGLARHELGALEEAGRTFEEASRDLARVGDEHFVTVVALWQGLLTLERGVATTAAAMIAAAEAGFRRVGDPFFEAAARGYGALALLYARRYEEARERLDLALPVLRGAEDVYRLGMFLPFSGVAHAALGNFAAAERAFADARENAALASNPNVRIVLGILEHAVTLDREVHDASEAVDGASLASEVEALLGRPSRAETSTDVRFALGLFARARRASHDRASVPAAPAGRAGIAAAEDGSYFRVGEIAVDLRRRKPLARLLSGLLAARVARPGSPLSTAELVAIGWPGELVLPTSAANRVHVAIGTLRRMGLGYRVARAHGGYVIPPEVAVEIGRPSE